MKKLLPQKNVAIISDDNVYRIYGDRFPDFPVISVTPGEISKRLEVIGNLAEKLLDLGIDRTGFVLGIGGGVVCDVTGFLGSIYMRGIRFGFVSSSLLSQVDASTGGKNGVNLGSVKNVLGIFRQPEFVICDPSLLLTLPEDEYLSGLGELIKTGLLLDAALVNDIEQNYDGIIKRDNNLLTNLIARSVDNKASVVRADEKEAGLRRILNFGHTFGHVIETLAGLKHGFAVAAGMMIASNISVENNLLTKSELERIHNLLLKYNLLQDYKVSVDKFEKYINLDKKKAGDEIYFVMLKKIGEAEIKKFSVKQLVESYRSTDV